MGFKTWTAILCAATAVGCSPPEEGVTVVRLTDGTYRLTLKTADLTDAVQGQKLLIPAALELCGVQNIAFGAQTISREGPLPQMVQDLRCEAASPTGASPSEFMPSEADEQAIRALSAQFLQARDASDLAKAKALFPVTWPAADQAAWTAQIATFRQMAGTGTKQAITRISWFENPPAAPAPGVYAAVDYTRTFERVRTACGFIVWRRQADGGWRIDRETLNYLTPEAEAGAKRSELPELRVQLGCR